MIGLCVCIGSLTLRKDANHWLRKKLLGLSSHKTTSSQNTQFNSDGVGVGGGGRKTCKEYLSEKQKIAQVPACGMLRVLK